MKSNTILLLVYSLNLAIMLLCLLIVIDANEQDVARVIGNLLRVVPVFYLADGSLCIVVVLQLYD